MSNIVFCELICGANEHAYFNSRIIFNVLEQSYLSDSKISFIGDEAHFKSVFDNLNELGFRNKPIGFKKIKLPNRGYSEKRRFIFDLINLCKCLIICKRSGKEARVYFLTTSPNILFFFSFFQRLVSFKVSFIFHSILSELELVSSNKKIDLIFGIHRALVFSKKSKYDFIVLGKSIKKQLLSIIPDFNCRSIFHPMAPANNSKFKMLNTPITIGFVGQGSRDKGFDLFLELYCIFKNNNFFRFKFIGRVSDDFKNDLRLKELEITDNYLTDQDYLCGLKSLNYMLILHNPVKYKLTASGTFIDAIEQKIPVIGINNFFIQDYFSEFGLMGYLLADFDELVFKLNEMSKTSRSILQAEYDFFRKNMYSTQIYVNNNNFIQIG